MFEHRSEVVDILTDREPVYRVEVLGQDAYSFSDLGLVGTSAHIVAQDPCLAAGRVPETFQDLYSRGLSSAVGAEEGEDFALGKVERYVIDGNIVAIFLGELVYLYDLVGLSDQGSWWVVAHWRRTPTGRFSRGS